jgi:hypothetical protein
MHLKRWVWILAAAWSLVPSRAVLLMSDYTTAGHGTYTQDFNSLPITGQKIWTNEVSLPGWQAYDYFLSASAPITNLANSGSASGAALMSFGSTGSSDRALGSLNNRLSDGVQFRNDGAGAQDILIAFTGEQWRRAGNNPQVGDSISVWYLVSSLMVTGRVDWTNGWTQLTALTFNAPNVSATTSLALDGNVSSNRVLLSAAIPGLTLDSGDYLAIKWLDDNNPAVQEHGLAIDDLSIQWNEVPEPAAAALGLIALAVLGMRRRACDL